MTQYNGFTVLKVPCHDVYSIFSSLCIKLIQINTLIRINKRFVKYISGLDFSIFIKETMILSQPGSVFHRHDDELKRQLNFSCIYSIYREDLSNSLYTEQDFIYASYALNLSSQLGSHKITERPACAH